MAAFVPKNNDLHELFEEDWSWEVLDNPEFSSQAGEHDVKRDPSKHLQNVTPASFVKRASHSREMVARVKSILSHGPSLSDSENKYALLFEKIHSEMADAIEKCPFYLFPLNSVGYGGILFSFTESIEWMRFEKMEDFELYHQRLLAFPNQIDEFISSMREGISTGIVASSAMVRNTAEQAQAIIDGGLDEMYAPLKAAGADDILSQSPELQSSIESAIQSTKLAFSTFLQFFVNEYLPNVRSDPGCSSLPGGPAIYETCLKYHTTTDLTPDEVHEIGRLEVAKIEARYRNEVLIPLGFDPDDFPSFVEFMRTDPQFYVTSADALLDVYKELCKKLETIMPFYFNEIPLSPLEITSCQGGPAAYYLGGTADGKRPGRFYVNTSHIEKRPLYESVALALHEAIPGHHHQCAIALENAEIPKFLRFTEDRRYEICPARRNLHCAYLEGWGLYCELLGEEMGMYTNPYELFGRLSMEMMRAVRLVVDTGLHAKGWSIEQCINYMMEKTGMHRHEVETEIYRYASWPAQACAYKIGQIEIVRLRDKAKTKLGDAFVLKDFHSLCLNSGPLPLSVLGDMVDNFIAQRLLG